MATSPAVPSQKHEGLGGMTCGVGTRSKGSPQYNGLSFWGILSRHSYLLGPVPSSMEVTIQPTRCFRNIPIWGSNARYLGGVKQQPGSTTYKPRVGPRAPTATG